MKYVNKYTQDVRVHKGHTIRNAAQNAAQHIAGALNTCPSHLANCTANLIKAVETVRDQGTLDCGSLSHICEFIEAMHDWVSQAKNRCANERARQYREFIKGAVNEKRSRI